LNQELISKKDLLELTDISYGQLYRWKRKKLIPEEWFVRKSTFTGQETFFPKTKVVERIEKIKNMKGDISLDDIANMLSPDLTEIQMDKKNLFERDIVSDVTFKFFIEEYGEAGKYDFHNILTMFLLDKMFKSGQIGYSEGIMVSKLLNNHYSKFKGRNCELLFFRKLGISSCCLVADSTQTYFEDDVKIIENLNIS
jgi:hypothetical protein